MESASDVELWRFASDNDFVIVSKDVDFLEMQLLRGYPPKIVWLNCGNVSNAVLRERLASRLAEIGVALEMDDVGVVEIE